MDPGRSGDSVPPGNGHRRWTAARSASLQPVAASRREPRISPAALGSPSGESRSLSKVSPSWLLSPGAEGIWLLRVGGVVEVWGQGDRTPVPSFAGSLPPHGLGKAGAVEREAVSSVCLRGELQGGGDGGPSRPPALFLAFPSLDAPTRVSPILRLFAPSPACLFCPGSSFGDLQHHRRGRRGEGRPCETGGVCVCRRLELWK